MKNLLLTLCTLCALVAASSCSDDEDTTFNPFQNWTAKNRGWFGDVTAQARKAIAAAKAENGDNWKDYCPWRVVCRTDRGHGSTLTDSVVMYLVRKGDGEVPQYNDSVLIHYRGWLCPTRYVIDNKDTTYAAVFDQSFYGKYAVDDLQEFDDAMAVPKQNCVKGFVVGFATALQYMHSGDQAHIYIPANLGYGSESKGSVPAGSALHFFVDLVGAYPAGTAVPKF